MRRSYVLSFALLLIALPAFAQQPAAKSEVADKIVAVVGDSIILKTDVDLEVSQNLAQARQAGVTPDSLRLFRQILDRRIGKLVLVQAAQRDTSIKVTDEQINT